jgi:hypothetical protein
MTAAVLKHPPHVTPSLAGDSEECADGIQALRHYRYELDERHVDQVNEEREKHERIDYKRGACPCRRSERHGKVARFVETSVLPALKQARMPS